MTIEKKIKIGLISMLVIVVCVYVLLPKQTPMEVQPTDSNCKEGKLIEVYVNPKNPTEGHKSVCLKDEISCETDNDCTLGLRCGHSCYNKNYGSWYENFVPFCRWDYPIRGTTCGCINGFCEVKYPPKCSADEDCPNGLKCYYGYCQ